MSEQSAGILDSIDWKPKEALDDINSLLQIKRGIGILADASMNAGTSELTTWLVSELGESFALKCQEMRLAVRQAENAIKGAKRLDKLETYIDGK